MEELQKKAIWSAARAAKATGGEILYGDTRCRFSGISIDSRRVLPGQLFVAIVGKNHDGHAFIPDALTHGISGMMIQEDRISRPLHQGFKERGLFCITVSDTTRALGDLAAFHRRKHGAGVVAITGSNGKTTTRRMATEIINQKYAVLSAIGNFNNEIGLPLTLLNLTDLHQWAVVELGMNHPGEIRRLSEICLPDVGVITNIAPAHLEGVGSVEGVIRAKGELLGQIKREGTAILNADDPNVSRLAIKVKSEVLFFGISKKAAVRAGSIREKGEMVRFTLVLPDGEVPVTLKIPGRFMVSNALAAAAVGTRLGIAPEAIKIGLENLTSIPGRMNILTLKNGIRIVDDTYNANPGSMKAAIESFSRLKKGARGICVVGDMLELGKESVPLHRQIGELLAMADISRLYVTGTFSESIAEGAREKKMNPRRIRIGSKDSILQDITQYVKSGDWILVKGSRGMAMESLVQGLLDWNDQKS